MDRCQQREQRRRGARERHKAAVPAATGGGLPRGARRSGQKPRVKKGGSSDSQCGPGSHSQSSVAEVDGFVVGMHNLYNFANMVAL